MIMSLFSSRPDHPLADPKELRRVIGEIPADNTFKAVDEIAGWLESLGNAEGFRADQLFDAWRQLDDAAQAHVRRLARDYLTSPRLSRAEEKKLWSISFGYWGQVASVGLRCLSMAGDKSKGAEALKPSLPLLAARTVAALAHQVKWVEFRYGTVANELWQRLGQVYLQAEALKIAQKPAQLYAQQQGMTTVASEYLHALVFHASSMGTLMPLEIEIADRLIAHFLPGFNFGGEARHDSVYWIDPATPMAPTRMAKVPAVLTPTLRFFSSGSASKTLEELMRVVERGEIPAELNLGGQFQIRTVLPVLRHLAQYWAPTPPLREHPRHNVKTRLSVLHGFDDCFTIFAGDVARTGKERVAESWVVENVSLGGFGAAIDGLDDEWLKVGALLCMQPEGGDNWVLGVVRRYARESDRHASVGIQTLARQALSIELRPRASTFSVGSNIPGIRLHEERVPGEVKVMLPVGSFELRESLEYERAGRRYLLTPIERVESSFDYEIGRYRELIEE